MAEGYWNHINPIWNAVSIYDGPETFLRRKGLLGRLLGFFGKE